MMTFAVLFPYLLRVYVNLPHRVQFDPEYIFKVNKTTIVHTEPVQTNIFNSTVICHPEIELKYEVLLCWMHNITVVTTLKYKDMNITEETMREQFVVSQRFQMRFRKKIEMYEDRYLYGVTVENEPDEIVRILLKHFIDQFDTHIHFLSTKPGFVPLPLGYTIMEQLPIGDCNTFYDVRMTFKGQDFINKNFYQIRSFLSNYSNDTDLYFVRSRQHCVYSSEFSDFLAGMRVIKYNHIISVINDIFESLTVMEVGLEQLPKELNPGTIVQGTPTFTETGWVKLDSIRSEKSMLWRDDRTQWNLFIKQRN